MNLILFCLIFSWFTSPTSVVHMAQYINTYLAVIINWSKMLPGLTLIMLAFASSSANPVSLATGDGLIRFFVAALKQALNDNCSTYSDFEKKLSLLWCEAQLICFPSVTYIKKRRSRIKLTLLRRLPKVIWSWQN